MDLLAASVPQKLAVPQLVSSTSENIEISAPAPSFDGGDTVTHYAFMRDEGPLTDFTTPVIVDAVSVTTHDFTGLDSN